MTALNTPSPQRIVLAGRGRFSPSCGDFGFNETMTFEETPFLRDLLPVSAAIDAGGFIQQADDFFLPGDRACHHIEDYAEPCGKVKFENIN